MPPVVSVIIPTYNCAPYLAEAIDSVLLQAGVNMEIIVVDDGSTDNTKEVIEKYRHRITYISQMPRRGASAARNLGIQRASGDWIAFQDADDIWLPEKLSMQLDALQRYPDARLVFADTLLFRESVVIQDSLSNTSLKNWCACNATQSPEIYYGHIYSELVLKCFIYSISVVLPHKVLDEVGIFDEALEKAEDYDLWLRIARNHPVVYLDRIFCKYRFRDDGLSGALEVRPSRFFRANTAVLDKHLSSNWIPGQYCDALTKVLRNNYWTLAWTCFSENRFKEARTYFLKELRYRPLHLRSWLYWCASFLPLQVIDSVRSIKRALKTGKHPPTV
jgi:glycosyltransferase involved in cell wall biosynthesis